MAIQNYPIAPTGNAGYPSSASNAAPAPASNAPTAINTVDQYGGSQPAGDPYGVSSTAPAAAPGASAGVKGMAGGLLGKLGLGSLIGGLGGALLGARVILPRLAMRIAPKVPPSMWLKFGVIGGSALAGAWLVSKLLGHKAAPAQTP